MHKVLTRLTPVVLVLAAALLLTACGSDSSDSSSGEASSGESTTAGTTALTTDQAAADVEAARAVVAKFDGPTESPKSIPPDKEIAVIYSVAVPLPLRAAESVETAAGEIGWKTTLIDGRGSPQGYVDAMEQAVNSGVDGIVLVAMPVPLLANEIKKARDQGIAVTAILPALPAEDSKPAEFGLTDYVSTNHNHDGYLMGQWVVQDAPEGAKAIALESPEFPDLQRESEEFQRALADAGPDYEVVDTLESPVTDSEGSQGAERLAAELRANPDVKYAFVLFTNTFLQAQKLSGRTDVIGLSADVDGWIPALQEGAGLVLVGTDANVFGWYAVDSLIREFNGEPAIGAEGGGYAVSSQLVDASNAASIKGDSIEVGYDYPEEWRRLWGLGSGG